MQRWWRRSTLSARLTLLVLAVALPMLVVIAASYADALGDRRGVEIASATHAARNGASIVEGFLRDIESTTFATASVLNSTAQPIDQRSFGPYLASLIGIYPELRAFFITDANGRVVASASGEGIGVDLSSRSYMAALKGGASAVWSGSIAGLQSGDITVAYGRSIVGSDGARRGFVVVAFYPERVIEVLRPDYPADARLVLIDERGHVVYDSGRREPAASEIDVSRAPGVAEALRGSVVPIDGVASPFPGDAQFGAIVPIERTGWALAVIRPLAGLEAQLAGRLLGNGIAVVATLLVAAALATLIANVLARPLRELSRVASAIARDERPTIPHTSGGVEVDQLAAAMRTMQAAVARREDALRLLAASGEALSGTLDYSEAMRRAARVAIPLFADWCVVDVLEGGVITRAAVATVDPSKEPAAQRLRESFPPSQPTNPKGPASRAIATRQPVFMSDVTSDFLERVARHPDELALYRELDPRSFIAVPLLVADRVIGAVTFITARSGRRYQAEDVTVAEQLARRIALAIENARLYYEVQQSVKTRDDFLSAVAHELKTPLTVISASAQILQRRVREGDGQDPSLARIQGAVGRMTAFIEELLELVRRQADVPLELRRARVDLVELVRRSVTEVAELAQEQDVAVEADGPVVGEWDPTRLERAVGNLVGNAIKYNRPGGRVRLRVGAEDSPLGTIAYVSVSDEGIGIPASDRDRIFDRFTRGANVAGRIVGSGVGLAIVRQVVEQHGGTVEVQSVEGQGSTFTIRLPAGAPSPAAS